MSATLYLRLGENDADWIVRGPDLFQSAQRGTLEEAAQAAAGNRVAVLVPAAHVLLTEARLPKQQARRLRQAVPYAIEEQLSDEVEALHFAIAPKRSADGTLPVAVVSRARMQAWTTRLEGAGLHPHALIPETLALPLAEGEWSLLLDGEGALLRTGPGRGYALDAENLELMLAVAFEQAGEGKPGCLRVYNCGEEQAEWPVRAACEKAEIEMASGGCPQGSLALLAGGLSRPAPIDLLQGDFSRREQLTKIWRPWLPAASLLGVWLLLQLGLGIFNYITLSRESAQLTAEIEAVYRQTFPEARNVANPRLQMEQHLARLRGGGSGGAFAPLMVTAAPVLRAESGLELAALRYKDGVLDVELTARDFQSMDRLKQALVAKGLQVEIQNASARGGKTQGVLRLKEGA